MLDLALVHGHRISIEAPAITLEYIEKLKPNWLERLRMGLRKGQVEFIGSGYSQIIGPLVPFDVNQANLTLGIQRYQKLLGIVPEIFLVNEMAFSVDLIAQYAKVGVRNIVLEWNNFRKYTRGAHKDHSSKPLVIRDNDGYSVQVVWADTIFFQRFQRYVHRELELDEYLQFLDEKANKSPNRFLPIYTSDAEVFDFRPGRYKTENSMAIDEWARITAVFTKIEQRFGTTFLSGILTASSGDSSSLLFETDIPVQVKKQDKYNVYRWAVGGRNNLKVNADCYALLNRLRNAGERVADWPELLFLWSSDFRTHITQKRFLDFNNRMSTMKSDLLDLPKVEFREKGVKEKFKVNQSSHFIDIETDQLEIRFNRKKGLTIEWLKKKGSSELGLFGRIAHGAYDDISLSNDYYSGYAICYDSNRRQHTHLFQRDEVITTQEDCVLIEAQNVCDSKFRVSDQIRVFGDQIEIHRELELLDLSVNIIHPFVITFLPRQDLPHYFYETNCGGDKMHRYVLDKPFAYDAQTLHLTVSAVNGFLPTEGIIRMGQVGRSEMAQFEIDNTSSPLVTSFQYHPGVGFDQPQLPFLQMICSAQEINDTFKGNEERHQQIRARLTIKLV